jgi:type VI secretion system protein ImpA
VRRATEWGSLNTVELYQELFLRLGGQLNIFEMLGLENNATRTP